MFQKHCNCTSNRPFCCPTGWKVVLVGSRFTSTAESRYAPVEGEALAVVYALEKARYFVLGCENLTVAVDHKPLIKIFGDRSIEQLPNSRLRNLKEKTLRFRFKIMRIPGVKNKAQMLYRETLATQTKRRPLKQSLFQPFAVMKSLPKTWTTITQCV